MMVEYLSNLADYLNDLPQKKYNLEDQNEVRELLYDLLDNPHVQLIKKLSEDILGFIDQMDDIGINYLVNKITKFKKAMLICHLSSSVIVFILFYFFVTKPIKKQLRAIDSLINIIYSIPHSVYNTSPVLKGYYFISFILIFRINYLLKFYTKNIFFILKNIFIIFLALL